MIFVKKNYNDIMTEISFIRETEVLKYGLQVQDDDHMNNNNNSKIYDNNKSNE